MNITVKKLAAALAVTAIALLGTAAPASAAPTSARTIWCC
jgi:hypothetical protein